MRVKLDDSYCCLLSLFFFSFTLIKPKRRYVAKMSLAKGFFKSLSLNSTWLGSSKSVSRLYLFLFFSLEFFYFVSKLNLKRQIFYFGKRCLGHGINLNSCGTDSKKLNTCGTKNSKRNLLKWPKMPTTAKVMPAK